MNYLSEARILELEEIAHQLRVESVRMIHRRGAGHPGGSPYMLVLLSREEHVMGSVLREVAGRLIGAG